MDTPRKNTSSDTDTAQQRVRAAILIVFAVLALAVILSACGHAEGTVTRKYITVNPLQFHMTVRQADGSKASVIVRGYTYTHCHKGDQYPACAHKKGKR